MLFASTSHKNAIDPIEGIETCYTEMLLYNYQILDKNAIDPIEGIETCISFLLYLRITCL